MMSVLPNMGIRGDILELRILKPLLSTNSNRMAEALVSEIY
jgi:hypothetical protein